LGDLIKLFIEKFLKSLGDLIKLFIQKFHKSLGALINYLLKISKELGEHCIDRLKSVAGDRNVTTDLPAGGGQVTLTQLSFLQSFNFSLTSHILSEE
jgi:hypothetical protein